MPPCKQHRHSTEEHANNCGAARQQVDPTDTVETVGTHKERRAQHTAALSVTVRAAAAALPLALLEPL